MNLRSSLLRGFAPALTALALAATGAASANASLITATTSGEIGYAGGATGSSFTNSACSLSSCGGQTVAFNFVYTSLASALAGAPGFFGNLQLDTATVAPPDGGPFLALDSDYNNGPVSTTISDIKGDIETVSFYFAGTQQLTTSGCPQCTGPSNDSLAVSVDGALKQSDGPITVTSQGFTGWGTLQTFSFIGTGSDTLSFMASSTTSNVPAFALVDDLTVTQTAPPAPEPNSLILLGTGLAGLGGLVRSRFMKSATTNA